jgi:hypothetical protein
MQDFNHAGLLGIFTRRGTWDNAPRGSSFIKRPKGAHRRRVSRAPFMHGVDQVDPCIAEIATNARMNRTYIVSIR